MKVEKLSEAMDEMFDFITDLPSGLDGFESDFDAAFGELEKVKSSDVAPVVHGKWVDNGIEGSMLSGCSVCGFSCGAYSFRYCPSCGAKMDLEG